MNDDTLDLHDYLMLGLNWWWLLVLGVAAGAGMALACNFVQAASTPAAPQYRASATMVVAEPGWVANYAEMAVSDTVLSGAIRDLGLAATPEQLASQVFTIVVRVNSGPGSESRLLRIEATAPNPQQAANVANAVAKNLKAHVDVLQGTLRAAAEEKLAVKLEALRNSAELLPSNPAMKAEFMDRATIEMLRALDEDIVSQLTIIEVARPPAELLPAPRPVNKGNVALGMVVGAIFAVASVVALEHWRKPVRSAGHLERNLQLLNLGTVTIRGMGKGPYGNQRPEAAQLFQSEQRMERTATAVGLAARAAEARVLAVLGLDSAGKDVGVLSVALASVLAKGSQDVVLVDANLRQPTLHGCLGLKNEIGLTTTLTNATMCVSDVLQGTSTPRLKVLTAGPLVEDPLDLLRSPRMAGVMEELKNSAGLVLVNVPPDSESADALVVADYSDAVVVAAREGRTRIALVQDGLDALSRTKAKVLGFILVRQGFSMVPSLARGA
ncbi:MAG: hypothetical protein FJ316_06795 [SAR202 cluster bacterium]|nr:hypothetical protein [SAR202 cluster bacterium]